MPVKQWPLVLLACLGVAAPTAAFADCAGLKSAFESAVAAKSVSEIETSYLAVKHNFTCGFSKDDYTRRAAEALVGAAASKPAAEARSIIDFVEASIAVSRTWRPAERLGDYYGRIGDHAKSQHWYETAIDDITANPADVASPTDRTRLMARASAEKIASSDDKEGHVHVAFARSPSRDGSMGGVYAAGFLRGVAVNAVPLPINFVFGKADFTDAGRQAVEELASAVTEQHVASMKLVGHADPRGDAGYNQALSLQRAEAVKAALLGHGVQAQIATEGRGASEPFDVSLLAYQPSDEEVYALDRRVEFVRLDQ